MLGRSLITWHDYKVPGSISSCNGNKVKKIFQEYFFLRWNHKILQESLGVSEWIPIPFM